MAYIWTSGTYYLNFETRYEVYDEMGFPPKESAYDLRVECSGDPPSVSVTLYPSSGTQLYEPVAKSPREIHSTPTKRIFSYKLPVGEVRSFVLRNQYDRYAKFGVYALVLEDALDYWVELLRGYPLGKSPSPSGRSDIVGVEIDYYYYKDPSPDFSLHKPIAP